MSEEENYDFIVGFTIFTPKGFRTMYRHFNNLETAKMFASNVNIKDNCKIYIDLNLYQKEKEKNEKLELENEELKREKAERSWVHIKENGEVEPLFYISKDKIKAKIEELDKAYEDSKNEDGESEYYYPNYTVEVLQSLLEKE